jgi:hypothetical protein
VGVNFSSLGDFDGSADGVGLAPGIFGSREVGRRESRVFLV